MNRLADAASPYLRQHAANPVDWWPWSDAAFAEAARRDVPVFLSIGYATCHWCHVMAHESFEDAEAAAALNAAFVCVKVDREERPDVDGIYMEACLALNGHGGWPLTALLTPEREPFYVATYLPKTQRGRRIGVVELAASASAHWREDARGVRRSADEIAGHLRRIAEETPEGDALGPTDLAAGAEALRSRFDAEAPGFGAQPKFPTPHHALFLIREAHATGDAHLAEMAVETLRAVRRGGVYDHAGGGLHRYATDRRWLLPHFEKMLVDQALYALACAEAVHAGLAPDLAEAARGTLAYALRDLRRPDGLFGSAEDADSPVPGDPDAHAEEGAFYLWTEPELDAALGPDDAAFARTAFGTTPEGTYVEEATGKRTGQNVLHRPEPPDALAARLGTPTAAAEARIADIAERLRAAREARPRPLFDDKALADGNGLMLAALAVCARVLGDADLDAAARETADALVRAFLRDDGRLWHRPPTATEPGIDGLLDDYAFLSWGFFELHQTTLDARWLEAALGLHAVCRARFEAPDGGFFVSPADAPDLIARRRSLHDGAIPSGNSVAVLNGLRLGRITGDRETEASALGGLRVPADVRRHPSGSTFLLAAARFAQASAEVVVAGEPAAADTRAMLRALGEVYAPHAVFALRSDALDRLAPFTAAQPRLGDAATAYVCREQACAAPTTDPSAAARLLAGDRADY